MCVCVHGLMTVLSAESETQEGISHHCISKALSLKIQGRVFLNERGIGCVCWCVCSDLAGSYSVCIFRYAPLKKLRAKCILYLVTRIYGNGTRHRSTSK